MKSFSYDACTYCLLMMACSCLCSFLCYIYREHVNSYTFQALAWNCIEWKCTVFPAMVNCCTKHCVTCSAYSWWEIPLTYACFFVLERCTGTFLSLGCRTESLLISAIMRYLSTSLSSWRRRGRLSLKRCASFHSLKLKKCFLLFREIAQAQGTESLMKCSFSNRTVVSCSYSRLYDDVPGCGYMRTC